MGTTPASKLTCFPIANILEEDGRFFFRGHA